LHCQSAIGNRGRESSPVCASGLPCWVALCAASTGSAAATGGSSKLQTSQTL
jgi:hypothetical protein